MAKRKARKFDLSSFKGLSISSFTMVETNGEDLMLAAERCAMPDGSDVDSNTFSLVLRNQMIAGSIVEVDDIPVKGASCQAYMTWNSRTRNLVASGYDHMNGTSAADNEAFRKLLGAADGAEPASQGQSEQT